MVIRSFFTARSQAKLENEKKKKERGEEKERERRSGIARTVDLGRTPVFASFPSERIITTLDNHGSSSNQPVIIFKLKFQRSVKLCLWMSGSMLGRSWVKPSTV